MMRRRPVSASRLTNRSSVVDMSSVECRSASTRIILSNGGEPSAYLENWIENTSSIVRVLLSPSAFCNMQINAVQLSGMSVRNPPFDEATRNASDTNVG